MVIFRKIVNVLVLVAYVKMTLVSSFAMDAPFHNATRAFKVTLEPTLGRNGEVQAMKLRLIQQDRSGDGKAERLLSQAEINVTQNTHTPNLKIITRNGTPWFVWHLPQFGVVEIDQNGNMLLDGVNQHHPATILKIKTSHLIMLRNCAIHNLHLTAHAAHLKGNNVFGNLKTNLSLNLTTLSDSQEQLRNLILKNGRFMNWSTINWHGGGIWNLRGNSFVNQGTLNLEEGTQTLQQALLVSNLGRIEGRHLTISTHNFHNAGTMDVARLWIHARHNLINQGQIHTRSHSHYQFGQDFKNSGQIKSEGSLLVTSTQGQGTLTNIGEIQAHQGRFESLKLVNHQKIELENSGWQTVSLENTGRFLLGHIDSASQSVITTLNNQGYLAATGTLTLTEDGENTGELQLSDAELIVPENTFSNKGTIWLSRLSGNGLFSNEGTYCAATTNDKAVINIRDFHNNFQGTVKADFLKLAQTHLKLLGRLVAKMVQITNGSLFVAESGQVEASTSNLNQVQVTNEGIADLGEVRLSQTEITNKGLLRAAVERADQASHIMNKGVFETRFNLEYDGAYQHQHYFFEKYLHNSGHVTVLGDYRPRTEKRDESTIMHLFTYEGEPIRVTGTLYLPLLDLYVGYHFLKDKIRPARLLIEAQGEDVIFDIESADWSFAKQVHIRNGRKVIFKQPTTVNHLRLEAIDKVFVDRLLHLTYGDLTTHDVTYFYVGRDNDHMAEIQAAEGAIDIEAQHLIDTRFGKLRSQGRLRLRAPHGKIQIGEQVVVPANEVASRVKGNATELLGCASWEGHTFYQDFYLSNGSTLSSQGGQVILEAQQEINGRFATILARQGLRATAPTIDLLSANLILLASSRLQADQLLFHRPANREAPSPWPTIHALVQTSYVPLLMVLGDLELAVQQPVLKGVDILVSGSLIRSESASTTSLVSEAYEHKRYYTPPTQYSSSGSSFLAGFAFVIFDAINRSLASRVNTHGTSGGNVFFGQDLGLTGNDLLVIGGGVSAQLLTVAANTLTLHALRAHLPRIALETAGLDKVAERLSQSVTTLRRTSYGGLTLRPELREGETEQAEPKTAPFWDETAQRFTSTYPTGVPFYLDNELEQITFTEQMRSNTGRLYDDNGHSGELVVQESVRRAQELATQDAVITEQTLKENRTCLLFYRLQKINGQDFLVATAHIPQTLQEDRLNASGVARGERIHSQTKTLNNQGGRMAATGPGLAMNLETETKTAASLKVGGQTVRPTEAVERGDFRQAVTGDVKEEGLISTVAGNRSVRVDGNLTQTNCQNSASKATTVEVGGKATLQSSSITSDKGPTYFKAAALEMETLIYTIYTRHGYTQQFVADTVLGSQNAGLFINVTGDMKATGSLFQGTSIDVHVDGTREFAATARYGQRTESRKKSTTTYEWCTHHPTRIVVTQATEKTAAEPAPRVLGSALPCLSRDSDSLTDYYENPVSGDGNDCAFNCLGTSRTDAVLKLLAEKDDEEARRLVAPEILQAFLSGEIDRLPGFQGLPIYQTLKEQQQRLRSMNQFIEAHGAELGLTAGHSWLDAYQSMVAQDRAETYPEFMQAAETYLRFADDLQAFAQDPEVYERYLYSYLGSTKMMGYQADQYDATTGTWRRTSSAFDLLARLQGQKLRIMVKTESGSFELIHEDDFDGEPVTLLHTLAGTEGGYAVPKEASETGLNHFNVLLTYAQQQDFNRFYEHKAAEGQVYLSSGSNTFEQGLQTQALNGVIKRSGGVLVEVAIQNWMREHTVSRKKNWRGRKKNVQTTHFTLQNQGCTTITQENDVDYYAAHGIALQASIIRARKIRLKTAEGVIKLLTALNVDCVETKKRSKDAVWQCQSQTFDYNETRLPCQFFYNDEDGIEFSTPEGIVVELVQEKHSRADGDKNKGKPREWKRFKDYSNEPGYEWMKLLDARDDVIRIYVEERHDSGRFASQGMTAAAKIIVSIILTMATGGAGGPLASLGNAAATTIGGTMGAIVGGAITTTITSLVNSMGVNIIDQRGQIDKATKATFSKEAMKSLGARIVGQVLIGQVPGGEVADCWIDRLQQSLYENLFGSLSNLVGQGIVYGNWREAAKGAGVDWMVNTAAQFGAQSIGGKRKSQLEADRKAGHINMANYLSHKAMHAALGAATRAVHAKLSGGDHRAIEKAALGGAIGAASAEIVGEWMMASAFDKISQDLKERGMDPNSQAYSQECTALLAKELEKIKGYAQITAIIAAKGMNADFYAAQAAALNAVEHNMVNAAGALLRLFVSECQAPELEHTLDEAEAAQKEMKSLEQELETAIAELNKLRAQQERLNQARYGVSQAGDLSVTGEMNCLFFDVAGQPQRSDTAAATQAALNKVGKLVTVYEQCAKKVTAVGTKIESFKERYPHLAEHLNTVKGYMVKAGAHAPKVISVASYALAMGSGALRGAVAGIPLSWPGMIGGAVVGAGIGYGTVEVTGMAFEAAANYGQAKLNEFADYAESIGRNETESRRNRYVAEAIGSTIFTTINAISLIRGVKAVSKTTLSALDLAETVAQAAPLRVPGRIQSRINVIKGNSKPNIRKPDEKKPGIETVWPKHMNPERTNKSQFTISKEEVLSILKDKKTVQSPITHVLRNGERYVREVDVGKIIGNYPKIYGGQPTSKITILSDKEGNLVNVYPGGFKYERGQ